MPSKSKAQQRFFGMVDAYKKGEMPDASQEVKDAAKGMTKKEVKDFASTKHKGLPNHVKKRVKLSEGELCRLIEESVRKILKEGIFGEIRATMFV